MRLIKYRDKGFGIDKSTKPQTKYQIIKKYYQTRIWGYRGYIGYIYDIGVSSVYRLKLRPSQIMRQGYRAQNGRVYKEYPNIPIGIYKAYEAYMV